MNLSVQKKDHITQYLEDNSMKTITSLFFATALACSASLSLAAGSGSSEGASPAPKASPKFAGCKKGFVKVMRNGKAVCSKKTSELTDEELYNQGAALALDGEYAWALEVLGAIKNQNDPRVLNYTGYSHRKSGRLETAVSYYRKALEINPNFVLAREYLGEGYLAAGRVDLAKVELGEIARRCGTQCTEYQELNKAIATAIN
jgi:tetratricopeptide (TPR) repeat protein